MKIEVTAHIHYHDTDPRIGEMLDLQRSLALIQGGCMRTLDETLAKVTSMDTRVDGIMAFITGLRGEVTECLSKSHLSPEDQGKVDAIFDAYSAQAVKIEVALDAGVASNP